MKVRKFLAKDGKEYPYIEIITKDIQWCEKCNNYRGSIEEKYNGIVKVHCRCTLEEERIKYGQVRSPCMNCPNGDIICWLKGTNFKTPDGETYHFCVVFPTGLYFN